MDRNTKDGVDINETDTKRKRKNQQKSWFSEKINTIDKLSAKLMKERKDPS
jgi:hypothetical protein